MKYAFVFLAFILAACSEGLNHESDPEIEGDFDQNTIYINTESKDYSKDACPKLFGVSPIAIEEIDFFEPMGAMRQAHVLPTDHGYFHGTAEEVDVRAPGDGTIIKIERLNFQAYGYEATDYNIEIEHACGIKSQYIHVSYLSDRINNIIGELNPGEFYFEGIPVEEGEVWGYVTLIPNQGGLYNIDFSVTDDSYIAPNIISPELYQHPEDRKYNQPTQVEHFIDPFANFEDDIRLQLESLSLRSEEPYGGKIDYDVEGALQGSWFEESTNDEVKYNYWESHLAVAPNFIDPTLMVVSFGLLGDEPQQFAIVGDVLPSDVGVDSGVVSYDLRDYQFYVDDVEWDRFSYADNLEARPAKFSQGTVLFEMLEDNKLRMEAFLGEDATVFTGGAKVFIR